MSGMFANTTPVPGMKTGGMSHQIRALEASDNKKNFAYLMEQGTGKTWTTLADIVRLYLKRIVNAVVVIAPNGVHTNWVLRELPTHVDVPYIAEAWRGRPTSKKARARLDRLYADHYSKANPPLRVFAINIDAINSQAGYDEVVRFLETFEASMVVVDESTRIKNPTAKRSLKVVELGRLARARRALSGTPLTKSPVDLFMQFHFLKEGLLGTKSHRAFTAQFAVLLSPDDPKMIAIMRKMENKRAMPQVIATDDLGRPMFRNLDRLKELIHPHCYRVTKEEALPNLPDKMYHRVYFQLTPGQRKVYDQMAAEYEFAINDSEGNAEVYASFEAIAARSKLKQITSGFAKIYGEPVMLPREDNPLMDLFLEKVDDVFESNPDERIIVWAMYTQELDMIRTELEAKGLRVAVYSGATKKGERDRIIDEFQAGNIDVFLGQPQAGGIGITLTRSSTTLYYSVSEDAELRMQSEDRNHRIGTVNKVNYYDFIAEDTVDENIHANLDMKKELANYVVNGVMDLQKK